ncbi:hypothetical protein J3R83DRAFT_5499 [Lanmaoa asiatica]|nr:hypothetical protein J3R83DRAFT_5499 [Lanmaoa asiatica]
MSPQCRPVCHKYGNEGRCRFLFPHETVEALYFDPETNSVVLRCQDGNVNYHNQHILVFCDMSTTILQRVHGSFL